MDLRHWTYHKAAEDVSIWLTVGSQCSVIPLQMHLINNLIIYLLTKLLKINALLNAAG